MKQLYLKQAEVQKAIEGTDAANTVDFTKKVSGANVVTTTGSPTVVIVTNPTNVTVKNSIVTPYFRLFNVG